MTFEELWKQVQGLPDTAMIQVPEVLKEDTKKKLSRKTPEDVAEIVRQAVTEIDHGSVEPLDMLVKKRL